MRCECVTEGPHHSRAAGFLGDTAARDYASKLHRFNHFAAPELRKLVGQVVTRPDLCVLDAGCGTGEALQWFAEHLDDRGRVVGVDLSAAHVAAARKTASADCLVVQGDLRRLPLTPASFDLIWSVNTLNHMHDPRATVEYLARLLRAGGRVAAGQSSFLADMIFAWDARLERLVTEAVRQYYRDRYRLSECDLTQVRALVGTLRGAGLENVRAQTVVIERISPLNTHDIAFLSEAIFRDTFGERLRPYLASADHEELTRLCDPQSPHFALLRPDFHFLQTFTLVTGEVREPV